MKKYTMILKDITSAVGRKLVLNATEEDAKEKAFELLNQMEYVTEGCYSYAGIDVPFLCLTIIAHDDDGSERASTVSNAEFWDSVAHNPNNRDYENASNKYWEQLKNKVIEILEEN